MGPADLPTVNAGLNATCTLLLVLGYAAIKQRQVGLHKCCMVAALVVSTIFLASYLYSHIDLDAMRWKSTPFTGPSEIKPIYYAILISHVILAAVIVPLALFTAWQGYCDQLKRHVKIARWTLPLWMYVSVTGVVVYWMLYRLYPAGTSAVQ
ncbi:hypothetical protein AYO44_18350 [Planctomycetaceae bacterium SCGC AG-212-F19]|nr:hypothetical protein AYO44_18350 [Planctomycetaceae bacterium SCGC AG-212-F19]